MKPSLNAINLIKVFGASLLIIIGNFVFGYKFQSVFSLIKSWIILPMAILLICSCTWSQYSRSAVAASLIILDYILFKIFLSSTSSPSPDLNFGLYLANISWIITVLASAIILSLCLKKEVKEKPKRKFSPMVLYVSAIFCFFIYFHTFRADYNQKPSQTIKQSKKRDVFVSQFQTSVKEICMKNETIYLKDAWLEKQVRFSHKGVLRKVAETGKYYLIIMKNHNIEDWGFSNKYKYYNDGNIRTSKFLFQEGPFLVVSDSMQNEFQISLKRLENDSVQFKVFNSQ